MKNQETRINVLTNKTTGEILAVGYGSINCINLDDENYSNSQETMIDLPKQLADVLVNNFKWKFPKES